MPDRAPATAQELRCLVVAPQGRDAAIAVGLLWDADLQAEACPDLAAALRELARGAAVLVATEEALREDAEAARALRGWMAGQPPWSDLPVVILARPGSRGEAAEAAPRLADALGNGTVLERPFHPATLVRSVRTAFRARRRQYQARAHLLERERAAAALRENEARLRLSLAAGGMGTWELVLAEGRLIISAQCCEIYGLAPDATLDMPGLMAIIDPADRENTQRRIGQAVADGREFTLQYRVHRPAGGTAWVEIRGQAVSGPGPVRLVGVSQDVTARKRGEEAMRQLNQALEARVAERSRDLARIFDLSLDILGICGTDGRFRSVSPAWTRITGRPEAELLSRPLLQFLHPDDLAAARDALGRALAGEDVKGLETRCRHADGSWRWLSWQVQAAPEEGLLFCVARDVTEERLRQAATDKARRLEALGQLTGGVAHDFNNLLQVLGAGLEAIERVREPAAPPAVPVIEGGPVPRLGPEGGPAERDAARRARFITAMRDAVRRGGALTRQLLAFARRQALRPEPVDVAALVEGSLRELLARSLRGDVQLQTRFPPGLWPALVDPAQLEAALINLAVNARDAMPEGGTLRIAAENVTVGEDAPDPDGLRGDFVRLCVSDTGTGMPPEVLAHVFEPFFTTKELGVGSGLGLAQVHGFARQSGGAVRLDSVPGQGTAVTLLLPRTAAAEPPAPDATPAEAAGASGLRILVVEDDEAVAVLASETLRRLGHHAVRVASAAQALAAMAEPEFGVDLLFTDVLMPGGMDGLALVAEARRRRPGLPALLVSGYSGAPARVAAAGLPLLSKPYSAEELRAAVAAATRPATPRSPAGWRPGEPSVAGTVSPARASVSPAGRATLPDVGGPAADAGSLNIVAGAGSRVDAEPPRLADPPGGRPAAQPLPSDA